VAQRPPTCACLPTTCRCMLAAPLILGNDPRHMSKATLEVRQQSNDATMMMALGGKKGNPRVLATRLGPMPAARNRRSYWRATSTDPMCSHT
jgi:hypothetical protein